MYILITDSNDENGAFSVSDKDGQKVLYIFQEEDDALRYGMMLEEEGYPEMEVTEIEAELLMQVCEMQSYRYTVITPEDIIVPPKRDGINF